jgi:hypothetical protein
MSNPESEDALLFWEGYQQTRCGNQQQSAVHSGKTQIFGYASLQHGAILRNPEHFLHVCSG